MNYSIQILPRAKKELENLPLPDYRKVDTAILLLADQPRPGGCKKLQGREHWRIRVGHYRIIYGIDDDKKTVLILRIGHRREVYR